CFHKLGFCALLFFACALAAPASSRVRAQQPRTVADGVYTNVQAQRGQAIFQERCVPCHGATLGGGLGPPLTGPDFVSDFGNQPLAQLVGKIKNTMPLNNPGTLTPQQAVDLAAFILQVGKFPAGQTELNADDSALQQITWPAGIVPSTAAASASAASGQPVSFPPMANLGQLMKGIMFPSSNIIFNVQTRDPGALKEGYASGNGAFSWVDWGAG